MDAVFLVYVGLFGVFAYGVVRDKRRREEILRDTAHALGGVVEVHRWNREATLIVVVDGIEVRVTLSRVGATSWVAHVPETVPFTITPASAWSARESVRLPGGEELGHAFHVTSEDPSLLRGIWRDSYSKLLVEHFPYATLRSDGTTLSLERPRVYESQYEVERGINFLLTLGRVDVFGIAALRALPDATLGDPTAERPLARIAGPEDIQIGPVREHKRTYTVARARSVDPADVISARVVDGRVVDDTGIAEHARGHLRRLGTAQVAMRDGAIEIRWPTIERSGERLRAGIDLLRALARGRQDNVFR